MADSKRTHSRKKRRSNFTRFPEVKGKIVESVEVDPDVQAVVILFKDRTALSFDLDPRLTIFPEFSDWKTGNWKGIKRWPALHSRISTVKWPYEPTEKPGLLLPGPPMAAQDIARPPYLWHA